MKRIVAILMFVAVLLVSCQETNSYKDKLYVDYESLEPQSLEVRSYNEALFSIDTADFANGLKSIKDDFLARSRFTSSATAAGVSFAVAATRLP